MSPEKVAHEYLKDSKVMQLGTLHESRPRVNSVYFVASVNNKTIYWISEPRRRHSLDIMSSPQVGGAIVAHTDQPVAGLQFTGIASKVSDLDEIKTAAQLYSVKYDGLGGKLYDRFVAGINKNELYKVDIESLEIFDDTHFPGDEVVTVSLD